MRTKEEVSCSLGTHTHIYRERIRISTTNTHEYPPPSSFRRYLDRTPVSSSLSYPHQPHPLTCINPTLSVVISLEMTTDRTWRWRLTVGRDDGRGYDEDTKWRIRSLFFPIPNGGASFRWNSLYYSFHWYSKKNPWIASNPSFCKPHFTTGVYYCS